MKYGPYNYNPPRKVIRKRVRAAVKGGYYLGKQGQPLGNAYQSRPGVHNSGDRRQWS